MATDFEDRLFTLEGRIGIVYRAVKDLAAHEAEYVLSQAKIYNIKDNYFTPVGEEVS